MKDFYVVGRYNDLIERVPKTPPAEYKNRRLRLSRKGDEGMKY
jgi:hypothetical protein